MWETEKIGWSRAVGRAEDEFLKCKVFSLSLFLAAKVSLRGCPTAGAEGLSFTTLVELTHGSHPAPVPASSLASSVVRVTLGIHPNLSHSTPGRRNTAQDNHHPHLRVAVRTLDTCKHIQMTFRSVGGGVN